MNEFVNIKVGTILKEKLNAPDGVQVNISDSGIDVLVCLNEPTEEEQNAFKAKISPFQMKLALEKNVLFFLLKFGSLNWMDAPYNVHLSSGLSELPEIENGHGMAMRVYLINTATGKIEAIRLLGLTTDISRLLIKLIRNQQSVPFDKNEYMATIQRIYATKSTKQLVKESIGNCRLA